MHVFLFMCMIRTLHLSLSRATSNRTEASLKEGRGKSQQLLSRFVTME